MVTLCPFFIIHRLQDHRSGSPFPGRVNYAQPPCDVARRVLVTCVAGVPVRSLQNRRFCWVTDKFIRLSQPPFWFVRTVGIGTTPLSPIRFSPTPWVALWYSSQAFSIPQPRRPRDSSACSLIHFRGEGAGLIWSDHPSPCPAPPPPPPPLPGFSSPSPTPERILPETNGTPGYCWQGVDAWDTNGSFNPFTVKSD